MRNLLSAAELETEIRAIGAARYHDGHPFHRLLHGGALSRGQVQAWVLNRYYYQARIPAKDAFLIARLPTADLRRTWRSRLIDHDGDDSGEGRGGLERWLTLAGCGGPRPGHCPAYPGLGPAT